MIPRRILIYLCFFLSGAAGLVYEVVWSRQLGLFLGITSHANTAVITAYMLGLAAGSWWLGRWSDRFKQPLRVYAWLEISIGLYAAATPWLFDVLQYGYARWAGETGVAGSWAHLARFTIALAALLIPTFLMGGTLPLLVRGVLKTVPQLGPVTGRLYGINTLGATLGAAITGFVLLPSLGVKHSIEAGVAINLGVAILMLLLVPRDKEINAPTLSKSRKPITRKRASKPVPKVVAAPAQPGTEAEIKIWTPVQGRVLLLGFAGAGFAALLMQLAWIRAMVLVIGGSVYAFTITLTSFLAGIGIGSLIYSQWLSRQHDTEVRFLLATRLAFLIGLTGLAGLWLIPQLPLWFLLGFEAGWVREFAVYQIFMFGLCFAIMIIPTLLMGALFPLLAVSWTSSHTGIGGGIGTAYAVNTLGTILGALLGGLVLLPWLGLHRSIVLASCLYCLVAAGFWLASNRRQPIGALIAASMFIIVLWLTPPWNQALMAKGVFYRPVAMLEALRSNGFDKAFNHGNLLYYEEGLDGTVAVFGNEYQKVLTINGKVDASSVDDLSTQVFVGQIGALMHPEASQALIIGLGSGITAGAVATHRSLEEITVLELSPEVQQAATEFAVANNHVLDDPRLNMVAADARNFILATDRQWDLIISEPSNPWISGVSNLFTEDFFRLAKKRLAPGGVMTQWVQTYSISIDDVKTVLKGFSDTYRYVTVWELWGGDLIMTGSDQPHAMDMSRLQKAFSNPLTGPDLRRAGLRSPRALLQHFLMAGSAVRAYSLGSRSNTDDRPQIEFNAPRNMYVERVISNLNDMVQFVDADRFRLPVSHQFTRTSSGLRSHTMHLDVAAEPEGDLTDIESSWWIWHTAPTAETGNKPGLADMRELSWREASGEVRLQVTEDIFAPDSGQRSQYLAATLGVPVINYGELSRAGDPDAQWLMGATATLDRVVLGLFLTCPTPEGNYSWYTITYTVSDAGDKVPATLAASFSDRFTCL